VWLALLQVLDRTDDRQVCLENIIAINPVNTDARRQLRILRRGRRMKREARRTATVKALPKRPRKSEAVLIRAIGIGIGIGLLAVILGIAVSVVFYGGLLTLPTAAP
jgi:hypothetical protein